MEQPPSTATDKAHGLALGKFAPFHRGHQLVVETALHECKRVTVVVYDAPSTTRIPLPVRAGWIRDLYPQVRVIEGWAGPERVGNDPQIQRLHDDFLRGDLSLHDVTHFYSSEPYGAATAAALGAKNRLVDPLRTAYPVSGTNIREDPFSHRTWVHPQVYRGLVAHVVLMGAPSSGKSILAESLAHALGTVWTPEYGREYWHQHQVGRRLTPTQLVDVAEGHLREEEAGLLEANRILITDTNALTTWRYGMNYHASVLPRLQELADRCAQRYDLVVLCAPDFPHDDTWDRSGDGERQRMHRQIEDDLIVRRIPFIRATGPLEHRTQRLTSLLQDLQPFTPFDELIGGSTWSGQPS